jgi:hypothetical protein
MHLLTKNTRLLVALGIAALATVGLVASAALAFSSESGPATPVGEQPGALAYNPSISKFLIMRTVPGAGSLNTEQLRGISAQSNAVLEQMRREGKEIYWLESYVAADNIECVYFASNPELLYEHAQRGGFPIDSVFEVVRRIEPSTGE